MTLNKFMDIKGMLRSVITSVFVISYISHLTYLITAMQLLISRLWQHHQKYYGSTEVNKWPDCSIFKTILIKSYGSYQFFSRPLVVNGSANAATCVPASQLCKSWTNFKFFVRQSCFFLPEVSVLTPHLTLKLSVALFKLKKRGAALFCIFAVLRRFQSK